MNKIVRCEGFGDIVKKAAGLSGAGTEHEGRQRIRSLTDALLQDIEQFKKKTEGAIQEITHSSYGDPQRPRLVDTALNLLDNRGLTPLRWWAAKQEDAILQYRRMLDEELGKMPTTPLPSNAIYVGPEESTSPSGAASPQAQ
jgi:hypothetical protein